MRAAGPTSDVRGESSMPEVKARSLLLSPSIALTLSSNRLRASILAQHGGTNHPPRTSLWYPDISQLPQLCPANK